MSYTKNSSSLYLYTCLYSALQVYSLTAVHGYATMTSKRNSDPARPARERDCALGPMVVEEEVSRVCYRQIFGVAYLLVMGVCGAVLVALGSTLYALAINCGTTATKVRQKHGLATRPPLPPLLTCGRHEHKRCVPCSCACVL